MNYDKKETIETLGLGHKTLDPFNVNPGTIEEYIQEKIPDIKALNQEILDIEEALADKRRIRANRIKEEVIYLRRKIGVDSLQSKVKGLSEAANKELLQE